VSAQAFRVQKGKGGHGVRLWYAPVLCYPQGGCGVGCIQSAHQEQRTERSEEVPGWRRAAPTREGYVRKTTPTPPHIGGTQRHEEIYRRFPESTFHFGPHLFVKNSQGSNSLCRGRA
jgi:hypothetical protein